LLNKCKIGAGIIRTISMSKTIKITANRKNRRENGTRALRFGSNPHSKGDDFSRSLLVRILSAWAAINVIITKLKINDIANNIVLMEWE
jgi:hypothetical protein